MIERLSQDLDDQGYNVYLAIARRSQEAKEGAFLSGIFLGFIVGVLVGLLIVVLG